MRDLHHSTQTPEVAGARGEPSVDAARTQPPPRLHFGRGRRLPLLRQAEATECGLACLGMIASYHGHPIDLPALRRRFPLSLKGLTLNRLIGIAQSLGLTCRPLRLELDELAQLQTPCILHWNLDHFVVLQRVGRRHVWVHDPAAGERRLSLAELSAHFTGVALELSPGATFQRHRPPPPVSLRDLAGSIIGLGRGLVQLFALALVLELFALLAPQFMQLVVDQVLADGDRNLLTLLGLSFSLLLLLQTAVSTLRGWVTQWLSSHFNLSWNGQVFQHLLRLPQDYFLKRHLGDIVSRFGAIGTIQQTLTTQFVGGILDGLMAVLTLGMLLVYSPLLAALTMASALLYALLRALYFRVLREANLSQIMADAKRQSGFMEAVRGVQTLRLFNKSALQTARYLNLSAEALNTTIAVQRYNLMFTALSGLTSGAQRVGVLWLGAWLALKGSLSAGMLMAFLAYADQFATRSASLVDYLIQLRLLRLQAERLADIVLHPREPHAESGYAGPVPAPSIRFDNIGFRYAEGEPWVLKQCSFEIQAGETVAIIGPSGCGKSTLVRLMLGLLEAQAGSIRIGGIDLKHLGKIAYRDMLASVMQDDRLFAGSIADNISFFDDAATPERIEQAATQAQLHADITAMPMGYHSLVGDMGSSLSGGQQQRLFLARALYKNPRILVLDEATSHLDMACERAINQALQAMTITRVVIAHRPETIASADRVLVIVDGGVKELRRTAPEDRDAPSPIPTRDGSFPNMP